MFKEFDGLKYECFENGTCVVYKYIDERQTYDIPSKLPSGEIVTKIGDGAFYDCSNLISINIPNGVTKIGDNTFSHCSSLASINIPEGVTKIGDYAFYNCIDLVSINIPEGVTEINDGAFYNCSSLVSVNIPEGITEIGDLAFYNCSKLASINIPKSVTKIGNSTFDYCSNLTSINIPEGITKIGYHTFSHCPNLASINIPKSVKKIGDGAFYNCIKLIKPGFFKATASDMCCRDFQYELEKTYETSEAKLCECGFHYCENAFDLFNYYSGKIGEEVRFFKVLPEEILEERRNDSKRVCKKITFLEEIKSYHDLLN